MKRLLQQCFFPPDYEQFLYQQYQNCRQSNRTVNNYTEEFYRLNALVNLPETENQLIARYIGGLSLAIQDRVALQGAWTMTEAVNLALKVETQINRSSLRTSSNFRRPALDSSSIPRGSAAPINRNISNKDDQDTHSSTQGQGVAATSKPETQGRIQQTQQTKTTSNAYFRPNLGKCFQCGQPGHLSNTCTKSRHTINLVDGHRSDEVQPHEDVYEDAEFEERGSRSSSMCSSAPLVNSKKAR